MTTHPGHYIRPRKYHHPHKRPFHHHTRIFWRCAYSTFEKKYHAASFSMKASHIRCGVGIHKGGSPVDQFGSGFWSWEYLPKALGLVTYPGPGHLLMGRDGHWRSDWLDGKRARMGAHWGTGTNSIEVLYSGDGHSADSQRATSHGLRIVQATIQSDRDTRLGLDIGAPHGPLWAS
jgi:hypothetical protein